MTSEHKLACNFTGGSSGGPWDGPPLTDRAARPALPGPAARSSLNAMGVLSRSSALLAR